MSTYHCSVKIISRSTGRSSVGAAAYRAGEKIANERDGITHDYTRKGGVVYSEIVLPENAPIVYSERALLWNEVERSEGRINSQTAREIEVALPRELDKAEQAGMLREYINKNFVSRGMIADFAIHNKDKGNNNPHAHILLTTRNVTPEGFTSKNREWNQKENVETWRESWAQIYNREMQKKSLPDRVDHRSYERQGVDREPTIHKGPAVHHMEMRGIETERGNINRGIDTRNQTYTVRISELREDVDAYTAAHDSPLPYAREEFEVYGIDLSVDREGNIVFQYQGKPHIGYVEPQEREPGRAMAEPPPAPMEPEQAEPDTKERSREKVAPLPEPEKWQGEPEPQSREMPPRERERSREGLQTAPDREKGPTRERKEPEREQPRKQPKPQQRGDMRAERGPALPLYDRAVQEMRKCAQIDNPGGMERALQTIKRENIQSYGDYDRITGDLRREMDSINERTEPLTKEIDAIQETIGALEIYEQYLPFRQEIEQAGFFQTRRLEKEYDIEIRCLEGSEERLERMGVDPRTITAESQKERISELTQERLILTLNAHEMAQKSLAVQESQKMMKQLFLDHGIDHEKRSMERNRALDHGMDR